MMLTFEFPERSLKRPIEFHEGKPTFRVAASSYDHEAPYQMFVDKPRPPESVGDPTRAEKGSDPVERNGSSEPNVKVSTEAGNAKVTVELASATKENLRLNCTEDSLTLSVKTPLGSWMKEIRLPFRVDPDTAKAVFRNGRLELVVRRHGKFNPPRPRIDWV